MFLAGEKRTFRVSSFEIISFSSDCFSGVSIESEVTGGGTGTVSRFSCFPGKKN